MERGSNKHGPRLDDALAGEVDGAMRAERSTRVEEWRDPEPSGEDQPDVDRAPDGTLAGGTPPGMAESDVEGRAEIAAYLGKEIHPAGPQQLLAAAADRNAPQRVLDQLGRLPGEREYRNMTEVWAALGGGVERGRY